MSDMMTFPDTWEDFEKSYGFTDNEEVYTNGARLIPSFRVKQWLEHMPSAEKPFKLPEIYVAEGYDTIEDEDGNIGFGVYAPAENQIYVVGDVEDEIRARALLHEVCHWVQAMCGRPFYEDEANEFSDIVYDVLTPVQPDVHDTDVGDLISRQKAKDAIDMALDHIDHVPPWVYDKLLNALNEVPSVQPETNCSEIPNNSDLISRQAAIAEFSCCELTPDGGIDANYAIDFLKQLPSVQPDKDLIHLQKEQAYMQGYEDGKKSRKGKWIYGESEIGNDGYYCSVCGNFVPWKYDEYDIDFIKEFLFCPNCGCCMEEGDSE